VLVTSAAGRLAQPRTNLPKPGARPKAVGVAGSDAKCDFPDKARPIRWAAIKFTRRRRPDSTPSPRNPKGRPMSCSDNVGNEMSTAFLPLMALNGRICISARLRL